MAVSPLGNTIIVNQMTPAASNIQNAHNNRIDFQNMVDQVIVNDKEKNIQEVRPAEENQNIDPDREHQKEEADQNSKRNEKKEDEESDNDPHTLSATFKLDIKV